MEYAAFDQEFAQHLANLYAESLYATVRDEMAKGGKKKRDENFKSDFAQYIDICDFGLRKE